MDDGLRVIKAVPRCVNRLLLVDADVDAREALRAGLDPVFDVTVASSPDEALARLREIWIGMILTDYQLGPQDRDGLWLLDRVRQQYPDMGRALMSTKAVPNVRGLRDSGLFQLFFAKPLDPQRFCSYLGVASA